MRNRIGTYRRILGASGLLMALALAPAWAAEPTGRAVDAGPDTSEPISQVRQAKIDDGFLDDPPDDQPEGSSPEDQPAEQDRESDPKPSEPQDGRLSQGGAGKLKIEAGVSRKKAFFDERKPLIFNYRLTAKRSAALKSDPVKTTIELEQSKGNKLVDRWKQKVSDSTQQEVRWAGAIGKKAAKSGKYHFRLMVDGEVVGGARIKSAKGSAGGGESAHGEDKFTFYDNRFPLLGKHDFGSKPNQFGAGRGGRGHQGHDVLTKCDTDVIAARGGKVEANQFQDAAGFYLVVDAEGAKYDYVYMHLKKRPDLKEGDEIKTGDFIAPAGRSGNASTCMLHFELWRGEWFGGGKPVDPLKSLKEWDDYS